MAVVTDEAEKHLEGVALQVAELMIQLDMLLLRVRDLEKLAYGYDPATGEPYPCRLRKAPR